MCGGILIFQGWRLDPILLLSQILLSGTAIFFITESLYLRNSKINPKFFTKKNNNNHSFLIKKMIKKNIYYQKFKLKKSLSYYKKWEKINYTIYISYKN